MTPQDFKTWRDHMGLSQTAAAEALGISRGTVINYESGQRREDGRPVEIPRVVALACTALAKGLPAWGEAEKLGDILGAVNRGDRS